MSLPAQLLADGFLPPSEAQSKFRLPNGKILKPLMIGQEGATGSGKSEFFLSAPGLIQVVGLDRGLLSIFDNPHPPSTRNPNVAVKIINVPLTHGTTVTAAGQFKTNYETYFTQVRDAYYSMLHNPISSVCVTDGDSDWWELHQLAKFGKTQGIYPTTKYSGPYAEKRSLIAKAHDSGKIVFATNKIRDEYQPVFKEDGITPLLDELGEQKRERTGRKIRQGFPDQDYLWDIQLLHMFKAAHERTIGQRVVQVPMQWGIKILKCRHDRGLEGYELWGDQCNFRGLVETAYPDVPLERWGF